MLPLYLFVIGVILGAACVFVLLMQKHKKVAQQKVEQDAQEQRIRQTILQLEQQAAKAKDSQEQLDAKIISHTELQEENTILKRDLQNFDVNMMISSNDAPTLENTLHRALHKLRVNKANPRKEFYNTNIEEIRRVVQENHGEVQYVADPEALEYYQSLAMSDEDSEFIEAVYDTVEDKSEPIPDSE